MKSREEKSIREKEKEKELEERRYRCAKCSESRKTLCFSLVFPLICGCGWSKSRLAKAAGAEPSGQMQNEKLHAPVARNAFWNILKILEVKMHKHTMPGPLLEVLMCKRMASAVAQSTFEVKMSGPKHILKSKCTKHTMLGPLLEVPMCKKLARRCGVKHILKSKRQKHEEFGPFWKWRCQNMARRCGAKHISKPKCTKHKCFGPPLEVRMSKRCPRDEIDRWIVSLSVRDFVN